MASPAGGRESPETESKLLHYHQDGGRNPEDVSSIYEELFDEEADTERPCYLPDEPDDGELNGLSASRDCDTEADNMCQKVSNLGIVENNHKDTEQPTISQNGVYTLSGREEEGDSVPIPEVLERRDDKDGDNLVTENVGIEENAESDFQAVGDAHGAMLSERGGLESPMSLGSSREGMSGYLAGSGSSTVSICSVSGAEETSDQLLSQGSRQRRRSWVSGKRHPDEDDTSASWRKHKKHFFILSNAGKPIYSRYGDEHKLAGFSATLQAIMSFVENSAEVETLYALCELVTIRTYFHNTSDHLYKCSTTILRPDPVFYWDSPTSKIVFLVKGPLYLVAISATGEPAEAIRWQLELLHGQLLLILTNAVEKCFVKNSKFDMRPLLGGTEVVFSSLIHAFSWNPASFLHAYTCLPLSYATRQAAGAALQDMPDSGALFGLLMCGPKVISVVGPRKGSLSPNDILLLANYISSSDTFRTTESFSPVCLPGYNPTAFLYAYVQYLDKDACLILLTADSDGFFQLKEYRAQIEILLRESDVLPEVTNSVQRGGLRVEDLLEPGASTSPLLDSRTNFSLSREGDQDLPGPAEATRQRVVGTGGPAGLWHFMYRSSYLDQYVASEFSPPLHTPASQKRLYRAYQKLHTSMHDSGGGGPHKMQYRRDENHVLLSWRTSDFELYAAFDPLAEKSSAVAVCNRICQWLRDLESEIFLLGATPFSW